MIGLITQKKLLMKKKNKMAKGGYTEYGYRGLEELKQANDKISELQEKINRLQEEIKELKQRLEYKW